MASGKAKNERARAARAAREGGGGGVRGRTESTEMKIREKGRRDTRPMKSIPSKLRESNKKVYIGPGTVVFSHLTFQPSIFSCVPSLLLLTQATKTVFYVGVRPPPVYTVYRGKSCQESLLQKRKVNVVVLVPVFPRPFLVFSRRPRFFLLRATSESIVPSISRLRFFFTLGDAKRNSNSNDYIPSRRRSNLAIPGSTLIKKNACKARNCRSRFICPREQRAFNERCE